jgi:uncharacterized protein (DUF427 family)
VHASTRNLPLLDSSKEHLMSDRVALKPVSRIRVRFGGEVIVDTTQGYAVHETGLPVRYYVPREEVRAEITDTAESGSCPWKGRWRHLDITVAGKRVANAAWTYDAPTPVCAPIRNFLAFYANKVDALEIE